MRKTIRKLRKNCYTDVPESNGKLTILTIDGKISQRTNLRGDTLLWVSGRGEPGKVGKRKRGIVSAHIRVGRVTKQPRINILIVGSADGESRGPVERKELKRRRPVCRGPEGK